VKVDLKSRGEDKLTKGVHIPRKDDIQKLLTTVAGNRHRPLIVTAALIGMRASELRGLAWDAVDVKRKVITERLRADEQGTIGSPKSAAGHREIPMMDIVVNTLRGWKLTCPKGELDLVFPNSIGKVEPLSNIVSRVWHPLQKKAGLVDAAGKPRFNFHASHHFFASLGIEQGFSQKRLRAGDARAFVDPDDLRSLRAPVPQPRRRSRQAPPRLDRTGGVRPIIPCDPAATKPSRTQ
jgi:integrase